jgi:hypothetical protein
VEFGGSLGRAICQVGNEPPQPPGGFTQQNCFGNPYWVLWTAGQKGGWSSAGSGISNQAYADGEAEGLSYGPPSPASPVGVCNPPQSTPASTPAPAATTPPAAGQPTRGGIAPGQGAGSPRVGGPTGSTVPAGGGDGAPPSPTPSSSATPRGAGPSRTRNQQALPGPAAEGLVAAAAAGVILLAMLIAQVLLPRLRR